MEGGGDELRIGTIHTSFFGKNLCQFLENVYGKVNFTEKQKLRIEENITKFKDWDKWCYDDLEEDLFDTFHTRNLQQEQQVAQAARHTGLSAMGLPGWGCPKEMNPSLPCTCHYSERANNHGYIDGYNWDSDWGRFSAGSD